MQIKRVEKEIRDTPYHKGTERHIGLLRAKLSKLRDKLYKKDTSGSSGGGSYAVKKQGDATVGLIGPPSVGKSSLINRLCNTSSPVGSYDFTTTAVIPGMMEFKGAKLQFFDLPGLIEEGFLGRGGGRQILSAARSVDLLLLITDKINFKRSLVLKEELAKAGFRLNQTPVKILIKKTAKGSIKILGSHPGLFKQTIKEVACEFGLKNAEIIFNQPVKNVSLLIDALSGNRVYLPAITIFNKTDILTSKEKKELKQKLDPLFISAKTGEGVETLKKEIWKKLSLLRVYLKKKERLEPDKNPLILPVGSNIKDLIGVLNSEWLESVSSALVWGRKVKFPGQKVSLKYSLVDRDMVYLVK